jgi:hypothetical protein
MSGIVLGSNTITINGKIMETGKFTFIQEPTSSPSVTKTTIDSDYKYMSFTYTTGANNTSYSITFNDNTECDILVVGGGGAGGNSMGGGGGAGGVVYIVGQIMNGSYTVGVGNGGLGLALLTDGQGAVGVDQDGKDSFIRNAGNNADISLDMGGTSQNLRGFGGGGGGVYFNTSYVNGRNGGSGGGTSEGNNDTAYTSGTSTQPNTFWNGTSYIKGGSNGNTNVTGDGNYISGGGGGLGGVSNSYNDGKSGLSINITGTSQFYAGGGGAGQYKTVDSTVFNSRGIGGSGVGGVGRVWNGSSYLREVTSGTNGTGSGGGGGAYIQDPDNVVGSGGSGIVIIRYKYANYGSQWIYSSSNPNVYHLGNVGIGTTNPTSRLHVLGSVQVNGSINATTLTANTKNFKIEHPLNINKWLYHGCVESPRFDNIYRGKKIIINGKGEVDIDEECNTTGGMTKGTFVSLNTNFSLYLQNKKTYDRIKGSITDGKISINCQNIEDIIEVDWLVMGERYDNTVITNELTNYEGSLICEHDMD